MDGMRVRTGAEIEADKQALRGQMRAALAAMTDDGRRAGAARACRSIAQSPTWARSSTILAFAPLPFEIDISALVKVAIEGGARVCMPRVDWARGIFEPVRVTDPARDLMPDRHGLLNPAPNLEPVPVGELDLALVPGLAFEFTGPRLGRGGGFYDRLLSDPALRAETVGVCFAEQIVAPLVIPRAEHDRPVRCVVAG
ncbi:MAG: 5-formyltetrahydrofolate cyclo-ligase [Phycisphaerales bacterium]